MLLYEKLIKVYLLFVNINFVNNINLLIYYKNLIINYLKLKKA